MTLHYPVSKEVEQRFWSKVDKDHSDAPIWNGTKCWLWTASTRHGYGQFKLDGSMMGAHRVAWLLTKKKPPTKCVLHHCDNQPCVNTTHHFEGTHRDNMRDRDSKGRVARGVRSWAHMHPEIRRGEKNGNAKLTEMQVRCIKYICRCKHVSQTVLGTKFGVSKSLISNVVNGKLWNHVR